MPDFRPTTEQEAILAHRPGRHARVIAGPGTGKSATLVALIGQLLAAEDRPRIRLLTFTRAATGELAQKVLEHPAAAAERPSTIHSFAISVLVRNPGSGDLPDPIRIADDWEYDEIVKPTLARRAGVTVPRLELLVREMAANWESLIPEERPEIDATDRTRFHGAWSEHRRIYGYTLLQELPYALRKALRDHPDLEGVRYDLLVVDEYQDLNACDLDVIRLIGERGCSIIGAGDDDQSIYGFRKAAPEGIRRFLTDYEDAADYPLSITQRCGSAIVDWASHVIEGDPDRPAKPRLTPAEGSPPGEVALLSFATQVMEAEGIAQLVQKLIEVERVSAPEILILLRGDHQGAFSSLIKRELDRLQIPYSNPDVVRQLLADEHNRRMLGMYRLIAHRDDSLAWASLLRLTDGIGEGFARGIYEKAIADRSTFATALLAAYTDDFPNSAASVRKRAHALVESILVWLDSHAPPEEESVAWGQWMIDNSGDPIVPTPTDGLIELLQALDQIAEPGQDIGRYIAQIQPLGRDRASTNSQGVRIMTMASAKGLTVQASIISAVEDDIIPSPRGTAAEERRLLFVAMTRAKRFLYCTWARRRTGPTARSGAGRIRERRSHSNFLVGGPVESQDGRTYLRTRWVP